MLRLVIVGWSALLLAACGQPADPPAPEPPATPLLWEISRADGPEAGPASGEVEGWLYGTIHALPDDVEWRVPALEMVVDKADLLIVEVANLEDRAEMAHTFGALSSSPDQPPLLTRVPQEQRDALEALVDKSTYSLEDFRQIESWGAALILAQSVESNMLPSNGVDRALIRLFGDRPVREFEGATRQFQIFDRLAEGDQRAMLSAIAEESALPTSERGRPLALWRAGDADGLAALSRTGILEAPGVRNALLVQRNREWLETLGDILEDDPRPLVAVGAAHLVGEDGLVALLEEKGYRVTRVR